MQHLASSLILFAMVSLFSCSKSPEEKINQNPDPNPASGEKINILSYNIHHANPPSRPDHIDLAAIAKVILDSEADIVGLQEVDVYTERSGSDLHQAKDLAELTGMYFYFSKAIPYQGGAYGTAILSKYPLSDTLTYHLPAEEGTEPRTLSVATVELGNGQEIKFANTHLDYTSASNALSQAKTITDIFAEEQLPIILTGDFNATPDSETINHLDGHFTRTCRQVCAPTIPVNNPTRAIDFIMFKSQSSFVVSDHRVINETYASDHLPVSASLLLQ